MTGKYPRTLVISHNVFSETGNMGKTMADLLSCIPPDYLAQLYFHTEEPSVNICKRYFRVTDQDVLHSVLIRKSHFRVFYENDIQASCNEMKIGAGKGVKAKVYQLARRRTPGIYFLRNMMWRIGKWKSQELDTWIQDFNPEVIFFASGDYTFSYRITFEIARKYKIPVVLWCCDDHYISGYGRALFANLVHRNLMKWVRRLSNYVKEVIVISDKMKRDYAALFQKPIHVVRISAQENMMRTTYEQRKGIVYSGRLGVNRFIPLIQLGKALREANIEGFEAIDVYSNEQNPSILAQLTMENGIRFHGFVTGTQIPGILGNAKFLLHIEAFDDKSKNRTRYSLSTKIGEYLQSGACLIAYGPDDISSIEYLNDENAAVILKKAEDLPKLLYQISNNKSAYNSYVAHARNLAEKNHNKKQNDREVLNILQEATCFSAK
ncbi:MAG: glycosyltransferase [Clostridiales bacterium]|nr:glycosyltransferase [Clostridiales bacterium]